MHAEQCVVHNDVRERFDFPGHIGAKVWQMQLLRAEFMIDKDHLYYKRPAPSPTNVAAGLFGCDNDS